MPAPCARELNRRIVIQANTISKDASGGMVDSWATFATVWAKIVNMSGNERKVVSYGGNVGEARVEMTIRYLSGVTNNHRISYNGKLYNIRHVNDYNEEHRFMILTCDTGMNDGR